MLGYEVPPIVAVSRQAVQRIVEIEKYQPKDIWTWDPVQRLSLSPLFHCMGLRSAFTVFLFCSCFCLVFSGFGRSDFVAPAGLGLGAGRFHTGRLFARRHLFGFILLGDMFGGSFGILNC